MIYVLLILYLLFPQKCILLYTLKEYFYKERIVTAGNLKEWQTNDERKIFS